MYGLCIARIGLDTIRRRRFDAKQDSSSVICKNIVSGFLKFLIQFEANLNPVILKLCAVRDFQVYRETF